MGNKVNPISMRLQLNKDWRSMWFVRKNKYAEVLTADLAARRYISTKLGTRAAISRVDIERTNNLVTVTIHTAKAGVVIGRGGVGAQELKLNLEKIFGSTTRVNIDEVRKSELAAQLVAENIANQIERRISFRRAIKSTAGATMRAGAKGIRIEMAGRLGGAEMSRREKEIQGSVPLHTIRADIDYGYARATYPGSGIIGIKVWIYKGEVI
jgi:small subunit ribosomal protein S3